MRGKTFAQYEKEQYDREQAVEAFRDTPAYADMVAEWLEDMEDSAEFEDALNIFVEVCNAE